jgi:hypothetical protein
MNKRTHLNYPKIWASVEDLPWSALVTTGRTGSDFLQSLFDSHPEIFVFNGQFYFHDFWTSANSVNYGGNLEIEDILDEFIGLHIKSLKSCYDVVERKGELGENRDASIDIDIKIFRRHIKGLLAQRKITSKTFITAIYVAYALCLNQNIKNKRLFFHHQHRISRLNPFLADFPNSKVITMTRDPRANYVSGVEHWRRYEEKTDNPSYPLYILQRAIDEQKNLLVYNPNNVRMLKLESLGNENTLRALCTWLGVSYDSCLTYSTWAGLRWWGDRLSISKAAEDEVGFSPTIIRNNWENKLSRIDQELLEYLLSDMLEAYSYDFKRKSGIGNAIFVILAILLPTTYERRYLSVGHLFAAITKGELRKVLKSFYHPLRRIIYYYELFYRRIAKRNVFVPLLK